MLWDSILPYSAPPDGRSANPWWRDVDPDTSTFQTGQFEGWSRNMNEGTGGSANFPDDRGFNAVFIRTHGLTQFSYDPDDDPPQPPRRPFVDGTRSPHYIDDWATWPFGPDTATTPDTRPLLTEVLQTYFTYYLDSTTYFMVEFSLRDLIAWMDEDDTVSGLAEDAIKARISSPCLTT